MKTQFREEPEKLVLFNVRVLLYHDWKNHC